MRKSLAIFAAVLICVFLAGFQVAYYVHGNDKTIYFTSEGLTYLLSERGVGEDGSGEAALTCPRSIFFSYFPGFAVQVMADPAEARFL
jgi:hypothetical protein